MAPQGKQSLLKSAPRRRAPSARRRFSTGVLLGAILVLTLGWFTPLLAQSHDGWVTHNMTAQLLPNLAPEGEPSMPAPVTPTPPVIPSDIQGHWAEACLTALTRRRALPLTALSGQSDSDVGRVSAPRFQPDEPATWSAVAAMLNAIFPTGEAYGGASAIETALQLPSPVNVLYTYPADYYDAERTITRGEAITAIAAKAELPYVARANALLAASLADGRSVPPYAKEGMASVLATGNLVVYPPAQRAGTFQPATRADVAAMACQASGDATLQRTISPDWIVQPQTLSPQNQPNQEVRGVWLTNIDSNVLFSRDNLAAGIQRLKAMNINTLYPVVWNMGYTQYPSEVAERQLGQKRQLWPGPNPAFEEAQGDRDMLAELIELAHAEGMTVIPWFEFGFMAPANYAIRTEHPDWFTQRQDGTQEIQMGEEIFTWMNPFHPRTRRLLLLLMAEVLEKYDVEGIQVDDHLGLPVDMGYDPYTIGLYEQEHGGESPPTDDADPEWMRWRADQVNDFMREVRGLIDRRRPGAILSVSPNPYPFSYAKYLQDWPTWEADGLLDEVIVQIYRDDLDRFAWELNKPATVKASGRTPTSIGLLSGLRGRPTDVGLLTEQLRAVRDRDYAGVSYFFYQSLWDPGQETAEEREQTFQASFAQPVPRP